MKHIALFEKFYNYPDEVFPIFIIFEDESGVEIVDDKIYPHEKESDEWNLEEFIDSMYFGQMQLKYDKEFFTELSDWLGKPVKKVYFNDEVYYKGKRIGLEYLKQLFNEIIYNPRKYNL